ncbi:MAG: hypothetical protein RTU30_12660 [Candidatus Thorarchaeota archaeon]
MSGSNTNGINGRTQRCLCVGGFWLLGVSMYRQRHEGLKHAESVSRGSKRNDSLFEDALMRSVSPAVECPNCDGNLDLTVLGPERIYTCEYCSASGVVEIIKR